MTDAFSEIEKLLAYSPDISLQEINLKMNKLEKLFVELFPKFPSFSTNEKAIFLKLLTRSNELLRFGMDQQMKALNLTPEKLKMIVEKAHHSDDPQSKALVAALNNMKSKMQYAEVAMAKAQVSVSVALSEHKNITNPEQQKLKRQKWHKA
jgi:hypothetical protein